MKAFIYRFVVFVLCFCQIMTAQALPPEMVRGGDALVARSLRPLFSTDEEVVPYLFSEHAFNIQSAKTVRFGGIDQGQYNPDRPIPFHAQCLEFKFDNFPTSYRAALVQFLFPSPDGVMLIPNQARSDPISGLSHEQVGSLLRVLVQHRCAGPEAGLKQKLFRLLKPTAPVEDFAPHYRAFLDYELKSALVFWIDLHMRGISDEELQEHMDLKRDDLLFYSRALRKTLSAHAPGSLLVFFNERVLKEGDLEEMQRFLPSRQKSLSPSSAEGADAHQSPPLTYFKQNEQNFRLFRFIDVLVEAFFEQGRDLTVYPPAFVERMLTAFALQRANTWDNVGAWLAALSGESLTMPSQEVYGEEEYWALRNSVVALLKPTDSSLASTAPSEVECAASEQPSAEELSRVLQDAETVAFLTRGFETYESTLPRMVQYRTAVYGKYSFPDCVESSIRNFLNSVLRTRQESTYVFDANRNDPRKVDRNLRRI